MSAARTETRASHEGAVQAAVVAGMHRSGTSAVARLLALYGFELPRRPIGARPSNPLGHWGESEPLQALNDEALAAAGSSWDDVLPLAASWFGSAAAAEHRARLVRALAEEYPARRPLVIKDPRICRLLPLWMEALEDFGAAPAFVLPIRNPLEVAASLAERNGFAEAKGLLLWLRHVLAAERETRGRPRAVVSYEAVLRDPAATAAAIAAATGLAWPAEELPTAAELERALPAAERHQSFAADELRASPQVVAWVLEAYEALASAAGSGDDPDARRLDEVSAALADADVALGPLVAELRDALGAREATLEEKRREAAALRAEAGTLRAEQRRLREENAELRRPARQARLALRRGRGRLGRTRRRGWQLMSGMLRAARAGGPREAWRFVALRGRERLEKSRGAHPDPGPPGARAERPYSMFGDYLAYASVDPLIELPLAEADRRVLGAMDSRRRQLARRYAQRPAERLVSVIMPTRDRLDTLKAAIASVQGQRRGNWELLVVDDASSDGTVPYVEGLRDERVRLIALPEHRGVAAARNAGLAAARGELIAYLDSDNTWHPDFLLVMAGTLDERPDADVAYCAQEIWQAGASGGLAGGELEAIRFGPFNRALVENRNYIDLNAVIHTARILERAGGFDESLPRLVDWELLVRYTEERAALPVPCVLSHYVRGGAGRLTDADDWWKVFDRVLEIIRPPRLDVRMPSAEERAETWGARPLHRPVTRTDYERPLAIVIPSFEAEEYLRACIDSVLAYTDEQFKIIVVDNGSGAGVRSYLGSLADAGTAEVVQNDANLGFSAAANRGIEAAGRERDVVLLNNDALATPGWVRGMWEVFDRVERVGMVIPRQVLFPGTPTSGTHVPYSRSDREVDVSLSAHHANVLDPRLDEERGYFELRFGTFFCAYLPRETIREVGTLNVEHGPHYRSDRLYCDMIREFAQRRIVYTPHSKLYHFLQRSTRELERAEPATFKHMFVRNSWDSLSAARARARRG